MSKGLNLKRIRDTALGVVIFAAMVIVAVLVFRNAMDKPHRDLVKRIAELSPRGGGPPETIDGLRQAIALYEAQIELNVKEGVQTGTYWKILAVRLADKGMHRDALIALEHALYYNPSDPTLLFLTGESAAIVAANALQFSVSSNSEKEHFYRLAESAYLRALEQDAAYAKPMLGLGMLYTFDLDRPAEAIPYLERYLNMLSNNVTAMFVLARAYYMIEKYDESLALYERILNRSKDPSVRAQAQNNIEIIRDLIYG
jgi:tetratricopeptide (TPR) repeat protein